MLPLNLSKVGNQLKTRPRSSLSLRLTMQVKRGRISSIKMLFFWCNRWRKAAVNATSFAAFWSSFKRRDVIPAWGQHARVCVFLRVRCERQQAVAIVFHFVSSPNFPHTKLWMSRNLFRRPLNDSPLRASGLAKMMTMADTWSCWWRRRR